MTDAGRHVDRVFAASSSSDDRVFPVGAKLERIFRERNITVPPVGQHLKVDEIDRKLADLGIEDRMEAKDVLIRYGLLRR